MVLLNILEAFGISKGEVVTLVGGGGKTTMMIQSAREVSEMGQSVAITTTTKIMESEGRKADQLVFSGEREELLNKVSELVEEKGVICVVSGTVEEKKLSGLAPEFIGELSDVRGLDLVIVEGDGAARKPLKAPASHEPVIPPLSDLVIPIIGMDIIGKPLNFSNIHRPKLVSRLTGAQIGETVTPEIVAQVLTHERGGMKKIPTDSRVVPLLNKVESEEDRKNGLKIAKKILNSIGNRIEKVILGRVRSRTPIVEVFRF